MKFIANRREYSLSYEYYFSVCTYRFDIMIKFITIMYSQQLSQII